ncbi:MAG: methionine gamma-lyase family protein, partial [Syntrophomonas sp.]|nr:methionine gamma-lyase family protein [Syntrophomonas sp.]
MDAIVLIRQAEESLRGVFALFEEIAYYNQEKILKAFQGHRVRDNYFNSSTGYGYGDMGRDELEGIYAEVMGAEDAMVRSQIVSGTHAISACLMALLRHGDEMISLLGSPYDTLSKVIGKKSPERGTLVERGIKYKEVELTANGRPDLPVIQASIGSNTRLVLVQRSRGYSLRPSLRIEDLEILVKTIRAANPQTIIFVDNCYGEFTDYREPSQVGVDLIAGSLIKNPGGGLVPSGGYIAGRKELVQEVAYQITAPGLGKELGASLINNRLMYQGLFMAPHTVLQAMKGVALLAYVFEKCGYEVFPHWGELRGDIVQAIQMKSAEEVIRFCQIVQSNSPVDSDVRLEYGQVPGYNDQIVMAAGTFIQGSSIELSCDAPLREPYAVYLQGGLSYEHCRFVVKQLLEG